MNKKSLSVICFQCFLILFFVFCLICCLDFSRGLIISLMEKIIGRKLQEMTKWNAVIIGSMSFFAFISASAYFFAFFRKGNECVKAIVEKAREMFCSKNALRYMVLIFIIFVVSYLALLMAHFDFQDDTKRIISGHKSWVGASRYVSEILAVFLHANFYLNDIAPLTQIIALIVMSFSSFFLAYALTDGKVTWISAVASTLLGTCPYFVQNMSFKFDSPYMALSMLFAVIPFLFAENLFVFCATSFVCLILVCSSYQAANSVYLLLAIFFAFRMVNEKKGFRKTVSFILSCILCYAVSLALFKLLIMIPTEATIDERNTKITGSMVFAVMRVNWIGYMRIALKEFGNIWIKFFAALIACAFVFYGTVQSKLGKIVGFFLSSFTIVLMLFLSYGAYLAIGNPVFAARAFMGFDTLVAVSAVFVSAKAFSDRQVRKILASSCICALAWGFCVNATVAGNAFYKQQKYADFRLTILLGDLGAFVNKGEKSECLISGITGAPASTNMDWKNYKINFGSYSAGWMSYILQEWNMDLDFVSIESNKDIFGNKPELKEKVSSLPLLVDNYYHSIYGNDNFFYVVLKNPQVEKYETE